MVLQDLGQSISRALGSLLQSEASIDEKALDTALREICKGLLEADVNVRLVQALRTNIKEAVNLREQPAGVNKRRLVQTAVVEELCRLVDPGTAAYKPRKGRANVLLMVGLQGSGKTTTCCKLANHYARKGWKVGLVCADTFRAGAFDQLKQNAAKARIPFYGSYAEPDPVKIVQQGIAKFKEEGFEIIIVDTSGRHRQEEALFEEMRQIEAVAQPDCAILVMDGSIGQAAEAHARAFKAAVAIGSIAITKMDGHAKGGGALSAVAATGAPIMCIGTGEHMDDLESFAVRPFISKLLGLGDLQGLVETVKELKVDQNMAKRLEAGIFALRDLHDQLAMILQMGPLSKVMAMMPGFTSDMLQGSEKEMAAKFRKCMTIMDSMTPAELDSDGRLFSTQPSRCLRVAKGAGALPEDVQLLLAQHRKFAQFVKKMGGSKGLFKALSPDSVSSSPANIGRLNQQFSSMVPPSMLQQMGGAAGLQGMLRSLQQGLASDTLGMATDTTRPGGHAGRRTRRN